MTLVLATHDPEVALRAHRVLGLVDGRLAADVPITAKTDTHTLYDALGYHADRRAGSGPSADPHSWHQRRPPRRTLALC